MELIIHIGREFEINYRLSYHCSLLAAKDKKKILNLKNQVLSSDNLFSSFHYAYVLG